VNAEQTVLLYIFHLNKTLKTFCISQQKNWKTVVENCSEAIKYDSAYQKAYLRRGKANMQIRKYKEAKKGDNQMIL